MFATIWFLTTGVIIGLGLLFYFVFSVNIAYMNGIIDTNKAIKENRMVLDYDLSYWKFTWHVFRKATK